MSQFQLTAKPEFPGYSVAVGYERHLPSFFAYVCDPDGDPVVTVSGLVAPILDPAEVLAAVRPYAVIPPEFPATLAALPARREDRHRPGGRARRPAAGRSRVSASTRRNHATCEHCGRALVRPTGSAGWRHVSAHGSCDDAHATPADPGAALRVLLLALLATGVCELALYDDGFEIGSGADDASLLFVPGAFTPEQVAGLLEVAVEAVDDQRVAPTWRPGDDPHYTRHGLTTLGEASAWRYRATPVEGDLSDQFWLSALGVEIMVRRRADGIYVSVENDSIPPEHGPLLVEVDAGGAVQYGEDHRDTDQ